MKRHGTRDAIASGGARTADWASRPFLLLLLFLGSLTLYAKTMAFGFLPTWDDGFYVLHNSQIQDLSLANLAKIFSSTFKGSYHPLPLLSYALEHALWGLAPGMYKAHLNLGVAYETKGRLAEAEREYVAAERIFPSPEVHENLQMLRAQMAVRASRPDSPARGVEH